MAPRYRAASARAAAAAEATCLLLDLSNDEVSIVTHELCDPIQPLLAVHLSSTCIAAALAGGALPSLRGGPQALKLDNNEATPAGLKKVKAQLKRDKCTMCEDCALKRNHPGICRPG
jgi:hypothetical protein